MPDEHAHDANEPTQLQRNEVAGWVRAQRLPAPEKLTLLLLFDYAGPQEDGRWACWPALRRLAEDAGCVDVRTVRRHIATMEEHGVLKRESRADKNGRTTTSRIILLAPPPPDTRVPPGHPCPGGADTHVRGVPDMGVRGITLKPHEEAPKENSTARERDDLVPQVMDILRGLNIGRDDLEALVADFPDRDVLAAAQSVLDWSKREALRSPVASLRHILREQVPLVVEPELELLTDAEADSWPAVVERLRATVDKDVYDIWLADLEPVGRDGSGMLVLEVEASIVSMVRERFDKVLTSALGDARWPSFSPFWIRGRRQGAAGHLATRADGASAA